MTTTAHSIEAKTILFWVVSSAAHGRLKDEVEVSTEFALQTCQGLTQMLGPHRPLLNQVLTLNDQIIGGSRRPKARKLINNIRTLHAQENAQA